MKIMLPARVVKKKRKNKPRLTAETQALWDRSAEFEALSIRNMAEYYFDELKVGDFKEIPKRQRRKFVKAGFLVKVYKYRKHHTILSEKGLLILQTLVKPGPGSTSS